MDVTAAPVDESSASVSDASCPAFAGAGADCCHKAAAEAKDGGTRVNTPRQPSRPMSCCPLAGQSSAVAIKPLPHLQSVSSKRA